LKMLADSDGVNEQSFNSFAGRIGAIFEYKLKDGGDKEYLLERALLSSCSLKEDYQLYEGEMNTSYLMKVGHNRWNFVKMRNNNNKKIPTWRNDFLPKHWFESYCFYNLITGIKSNDEINSLRKIIENHKLNPNDWRYHLVEHVENIDYCRQGFIRFNNENDILLYGSSQSNHYHRELFSSGFYEKYRKKRKKGEFDIFPFTNFWYHEVKSSSHTACAVLDGFMRGYNHYAIDISFQQGMYHIKFFNRKEHTEIEAIVKNKLMEIEVKFHPKFLLKKSEGLNKLVVMISGQYAVEYYLNEIFKKLKELQ
jgi:hypothetical protein